MRVGEAEIEIEIESGKETVSVTDRGRKTDKVGK